MSDPFIGEIRMFTGDFAPKDWAFCDGSLLPISQHSVLFAVIGSNFGGDGRTTLGLPNLNDRAVMHPGSGPGLSYHSFAEQGGAPDVFLTESQLPAHSHDFRVNCMPADAKEPAEKILASSAGRAGAKIYAASGLGSNNMNSNAIESSGGTQPHDNMQPYLGVNFIICLEGIFPSRS